MLSSSVALSSLAMARYRETKKLTTLYAFTGAAALKLTAGSLLGRVLVADDDPRGNPFINGFFDAFFPSVAISSIIPYKAIKSSFRETTRSSKTLKKE